MDICSIADCGRPADGGRGWCKKHYMRWYKRGGGDPAEILVYSFRSDDPAILKKRFDQKWKLDSSSGCWVWTSSRFKPHRNYAYQCGQIVINGVKKRAHRVSWQLHKGELPDDLDVLHTCDNGLCVNPAHLYLGTHDDNMRDMVARGRISSFADGKRKLSDQNVKDIRASDESTKALCARYNVDKSTVNRIRRGEVRKYC